MIGHEDEPDVTDDDSSRSRTRTGS